MPSIGSANTARAYAGSVLKQYEVSEQYINLAKMIADLMQMNFYGGLEIKFEAGKITVCKRVESIKL